MKSNFDIGILHGIKNNASNTPIDERKEVRCTQPLTDTKKSIQGQNNVIQGMGQTASHKEAYISRVRNSFSVAYKFFDKHKYARADEDWGRVAANVPNDTDPLTIDLIVAVLRELERESNEFKGVTA